MAKEICISSTPHETRLAIVEDDQLTEIYYERENEYTLAGSIYKGKVTRVLPGMQSAFVDLGLERDAFLYVTDFLEEQENPEEYEAVKATSGGGGRERNEGGGRGRRGGERGGERAGERGGDRQRERGGERSPEPAAASPSDSYAAGHLSIEPEGSALGEATGRPAGEAQEGEEFEEGTRRWRGRRGRRRGLRGVRDGEPVSNEAAAEGSETQRSGRVHIDAEAAQPSAAAEPRRERSPRNEPRGESRNEGRGDGRRDRESSPRTPTITLPGEALQKYGQQPAEAPAASAASQPAARPRTAQVTVRPSTLVEHSIEWDGVSVALPGETLSRHREPRSSTPADAHTAPEPVFAEPIGELHGVMSETEPIDSIFPPPTHTAAPVADEAEPGASVLGEAEPLAPLVLEEQEETTEYNPNNASASHRVDPSSPSEFRLSSLFGRDPEPDDKASDTGLEPDGKSPDAAEHADHDSAHQAAHQDTPHHDAAHHDSVYEPAHASELDAANGTSLDATAHDSHGGAPSPEARALEHLHAFTPGDGQVEEEVIDEEEYDFAPLPEHAMAHDEDQDSSDLLEEETQTSNGGDFGEAIRDAQIDREITSSEDDDFEEGDEEEDAVEEPATVAVAGEEEAPARRGGRNDRQKGRERRGRGRNGRRQSAQTSDLPIISELLKQGQEILVQIAKEPIAKKGARITSHIALPGRFLVFMPTVNHVGVSRKISSDEERQRLKRILISEKGEATGGFIVRTAAENASEDELRADLRFLISLWTEIKQRSESAKAPALIYHDLNLIERILRDQVSDNFSTIWVDSEAEYERIVRFLNRFQPSLVRRVKLYTKETPLFEHFGIQDEISKALKSKVWLKSGGSIVINQTEALVAIDINTGKYVGKTARLEDTILKTNLDAIPEIVRQIRLRDLGGIIVIDFIDMDERKNRHKVMQALEEELKQDRAPSKVLQFNDFGLVAITRKRVKQSLERTLSVQCNICAGTGMVKGPITVANEIYTEMRKMQKHFERHDVMLRVHPEVVKTLKGNNARWLNELEEMTGRTVIVKSDPALHPEQFDIH